MYNHFSKFTPTTVIVGVYKIIQSILEYKLVYKFPNILAKDKGHSTLTWRRSIHYVLELPITLPEPIMLK